MNVHTRLAWPCTVFLLLLLTFSDDAARGSSPLYAVGGPDQSTSTGLYSIDPGTGAATLVGEFGLGIFMAGLTYDPATDTFYGSSIGGGAALYRINRLTAEATLIHAFPSGQNSFHGIAYDGSTGTLFGVIGGDVSSPRGLYEINPQTAATTFVGPTLFHGEIVGGLEADPATGTLYAASGVPDVSGTVMTLNKQTGAATVVVDDLPPLSSISFDPQTGLLYGMERFFFGDPSHLYTIDLQTGTSTLIGTTGDAGFNGMAFIPEPTQAAACMAAAFALRRNRQYWRRWPATGRQSSAFATTRMASRSNPRPSIRAASLCSEHQKRGTLRAMPCCPHSRVVEAGQLTPDSA